MARTQGERQHLRDDVVVHGREECRLLGITQRVRVEGNVIGLDAGTSDGRAGYRADVRETAAVAGRARRTVRRAGRHGSLYPFGLIVYLAVFDIRADDAAQAPVLRRAETKFVLQVLVVLQHRVPGGGRREAGRLELRIALAAVDIEARTRAVALIVVG